MRLPSRLWAVQALLLVCCALAAAVILPRLAPVTPDLLLVVVVAGALRAGTLTGSLLGLAAGLLSDLVPPTTLPAGLAMLAYAAAGGLAGTAHHHLRHSALLPGLAVAAAALVLQLFRLERRVVAGLAMDLVPALGTVLLTTLLGALLVPPLLRWEQGLVERGRA